MKIREVIDRILAYHPYIPDYENNPRACDGFKCGDPDQECTGIVTSIAPSVDVIRKAAELGYNLIVVHEPAFYTHLDPVDWLSDNDVYLAKAKLIEENNIVIWRDHDHIHRHEPDGIAYGVMKELGWEDYLISKNVNKPKDFRLPQTTVRELALFLKEKLGLNGIRVLGNLDAEVSTVSFVGHVFDGDNEYQKAITKRANDEKIDVLIPAECVDWTVASYVRDAGQLGMCKAMIQLGHINSEELGFKWAVNWIGDLIDHQLPIQFVRAADTYQYIL